MTKFDFSSKSTVQEMQTWNKRYKLGEDTTRVIDTFDDGEFLTIHPNEAYNLCITLNGQHEQIQDLKTMNKFLDTENNQIHNELKTRTQIQHKLEKENEQLTQEIETLQEQLAHFDIGDV